MKAEEQRTSQVALQRGHKLRHRTLAVLAVTVVVLAFVAVGLVAKYVMEHDRDAEMVAADFHISSNLLKEPAGTPAAGPEYPASWNSDGTFSVPLYNWEVENTDEVSQVSITYQVAVTGGVLVTVTRDGAEVSPSSGSGASAKYELPRARAKDSKAPPEKVAHDLVVRPTSDSVKVTVSATAPYVKTLEATFDTTGVQVRQEDAGGGVTRLVIITNQYEGDLKLRWSKGAFFPNAGVDEQSFGWTVGYGGREDGTYDDGEAAIEARKQSTYYFEFNGSSIGDAITGEFTSKSVTYDATGRTGAVVTVT